MKKITFSLFILISFSPFLFAQIVTANVQEKTDTIFKLGGKELYVNVTKVTATNVSYVFQGKKEVYSVQRKLIERIVYKNGRKEFFNKPVFQMISDVTDWRTILVTEDKNDVKGFFEIGRVEGKSSASSKSKKAAKNSATIRLQKKAANIGGVIVLITKTEAKGGYGELPGYNIKGIVYIIEPPEKEK